MEKQLIQQAAQLKACWLIIQIKLTADAPLSTDLTHLLHPGLEFKVINLSCSIKVEPFSFLSYGTI